MPPQLATVIVFLFILYLFMNDGRMKDEGVSKAVYLPFFWFLFAGSRFLSQWLSLSAPAELTVESYFEGSPIDRLVFFGIIAGGIFVVIRRKVDMRLVIRNNPWIVLYFAFGLLSILWSDFPSISLKRLTKALGNPIMALVLLTEEHPDRATGWMIRRAAYLLLPLSVLFINYYPNIGVQYHTTGMRMPIGVTTSKNQLGELCLISGIYFAWELLIRREYRNRTRKRSHLAVLLVMSVITAWLLRTANSMTSMVTLTVALALLLLSSMPSVIRKPSRVMSVELPLAIILLALLLSVNLLSSVIVGVLGRDLTLTTRVPMWYGLMGMANRPIVGVGYESFWLGDRLSTLWQLYGTLHQAHNGYLEVFLNLGAIGLFLIIVTLISGFPRIKRQLDKDYSFAVLRFVFLMTVIIHNWTEASFYGVSNMWLVMYLAVLEVTNERKAEHVVRVTSNMELPQADS